MAITYPRPLLDGFDFQDFTFIPIDGASLTRAGDGRVIDSIDWQDFHWEVDIETEPLGYAERLRWSAWRSSQRGGMKGFRTWDRARPYPAAYPSGVPYMLTGSPPWNGQGDVTTLAAQSIIASGVPAGFVLSEGDLVGLVESTRYHVFEVSEQATAISGGQITVPLCQQIPLAAFTTAATAVFYRPEITMVIEPDSFSCPLKGDLEPVRWRGVQYIPQ